MALKEIELKSLQSIQIDGHEIAIHWFGDTTSLEHIFADVSPAFVIEFVDDDNGELLEPPEYKVPQASLGQNPADKENTSSIAETLLVPVDEQSPNHILNSLNDDCIAAIFEQDQISFTDLQELAVVCKHFKLIAQTAMQLRRRRYADHYLELTSTKPLWQVEKFLMEFGASVKCVNLKSFDISPKVVLGMVLEYCTNINNVSDSVLHQETINEMAPLFGRLRRLHLDLHTSIDLNALNVNDSRLEALSLYTYNSNDALILPAANLSQLTDLEWYAFGANNILALTQFIATNPQLQVVTVNDNGGHLVRRFQYFMEHLPELQTLRFTYAGYHSVEDDYLRFTRINGKIEFYAEGKHFTNETMLETLCSLQHMHIPLDTLLVNVQIDEIYANEEDAVRYIDVIGQFKTITSLDVQGLDDRAMIQLARHLPNLTCFSVSSSSITFNGIMNVMKIATAVVKGTFGTCTSVGDENELIAIDCMRLARNIDLNVHCQLFGRVSDVSNFCFISCDIW